jgi:hypothetical protein
MKDNVSLVLVYEPEGPDGKPFPLMRTVDRALASHVAKFALRRAEAEEYLLSDIDEDGRDAAACEVKRLRRIVEAMA